MSSSASLLTLQFLSWVAARPRSYAEVKEAWRSSCALTCAWEDAFNDDLVRLANAGERLNQSQVVLTQRGRDMLEAGSAGEAAKRPIPLDRTDATG